ncbi:hypothetical protein MHYP_G00262500 [Metynnis hypsauchen]
MKPQTCSDIFIKNRERLFSAPVSVQRVFRAAPRRITASSFWRDSLIFISVKKLPGAPKYHQPFVDPDGSHHIRL